MSTQFSDVLRNWSQSLNTSRGGGYVVRPAKRSVCSSAVFSLHCRIWIVPGVARQRYQNDTTTVLYIV